MRDFYANVLSLALAAWAITSTRAATTASPVVDLGEWDGDEDGSETMRRRKTDLVHEWLAARVCGV